MRFYPWKYILGMAVAMPAFIGIVAAQEKKSNLPDGPGKDSLERVCSSCHELESVTAARRTKAGWQRTIDDMVDRGAEGSDEDMAAILSYLTTFYGRVNVNAATAQELEKSLDLSAKEAQAIVAYREHNGKIKNLDELKNIPGVDADKLQAKRASIAFAP
jgi:competence ComEA-like helix-hairpin-helix protein